MQLAQDALVGGDQAPHVVRRQTARGLRGDRGGRERARGRLEAAVDRLGAPVLQGGRVLAQDDPQRVTPGQVERLQDLVELHRRRRLCQRDGAAVGEISGGRRPRVQVDEEVALQEQARAHLHGGVAVQRQAPVGDLQRHDRRRPGAAAGAHDLADLDPGDAHGRVSRQAGGQPDHSVHLVVGADRHRAAEGEIAQHRDRADDGEADALVVTVDRLRGDVAPAHRGPSGVPGGGAVSSSAPAWRPGTGPMRRPGR